MKIINAIIEGLRFRKYKKQSFEQQVLDRLHQLEDIQKLISEEQISISKKQADIENKLIVLIKLLI